MTNSSLQETSTPIVATPNSRGVVQPKVATPEALQLLNLEPLKTVWGWEGRTVLERLPAESQAYQLGYDKDQAYVYIEPQFGLGYGPGSIEVGYDTATQKVLSIEDGLITWKKGQAGVQLLQVDISTLNEGLGLQDGEYQTGYTLRVDYASSDSLIPGYSEVSVTDESLAKAALVVAASGQSGDHRKSFALESTAVNETWWPGKTTAVNEYYPGAWLVLDFLQPAVASAFKVVGDKNIQNTASCTLYYSDDAIVWNKSVEVRPIDNDWLFEVFGDTTHRYWKLFFWGGDAAVSDIRYTGNAYYPDNRTVGPVPIAEPYIDDLYEEIVGDFILLAHFTVVNGIISEVRDQRSFINRKYEPVAEWLTTFPDEQIRCLFDDVQNYSAKFLSPPTADFHFYNEMDDSICDGLGELTIGNEEEEAVIVFPDVVEITTATGSGVIAGLTAPEVNLVLAPTTDGGLATKVSTDDTFDIPFTCDDGIY